jgi:hypothetical protein
VFDGAVAMTELAGRRALQLAFWLRHYRDAQQLTPQVLAVA